MIKWLKALLARGFKFKIKREWAGDEKLNHPNREPDISSKTIEKEITDSIKDRR